MKLFAKMISDKHLNLPLRFTSLMDTVDAENGNDTSCTYPLSKEPQEGVSATIIRGFPMLAD